MPAQGRRAPEYPAIRPVVVGRLNGAELEMAVARIDEKHATRFVGQSVAREPDPLQAAWCDMVQDHMSGEGDCFFTGTYSEQYGYSHGLMKAHNVMKDFRRFLEAQGLAERAWVCAVELHRYRDILHLHALISGVGDRVDLTALEHAWRTSQRGQQVTADPLLDRGYAYCTKYALKGDNAADFDWSWTA